MHQSGGNTELDAEARTSNKKQRHDNCWQKSRLSHSPHSLRFFRFRFSSSVCDFVCSRFRFGTRALSHLPLRLNNTNTRSYTLDLSRALGLGILRPNQRNQTRVPSPIPPTLPREYSSSCDRAWYHSNYLSRSLSNICTRYLYLSCVRHGFRRVGRGTRWIRWSECQRILVCTTYLGARCRGARMQGVSVGLLDVASKGTIMYLAPSLARLLACLIVSRYRASLPSSRSSWNTS